MALPFDVGNLPSQFGPAPSFPYPPSLAQPFTVGGIPQGAFSPYPNPPLPPSLSAAGPSIGTAALPATEAAAATAASNGATGLARFIPAFLRPAEDAATFSKAGIGPGLGYSIAGDLAAMGARAVLPNGKVEHVVSPALAGAGFGAGIGSAFPVVGTAAGAAIGGGLGALYGLFHKAATAPATINLAHLYQTANLDPASIDQYDRYFKVLTSLDNSKKGRDAARGTIANLVLQKVAQGQTSVHSFTPSEMAAMQTQTAAFLKPYTDQSIQTARLAAQNTFNELPNVPAAYRGVLSAGAGNQLAASTRLANAYAAQAQLAPQTMALQQSQQEQMALARQIQQQALAAQLSGQSQGNGANLSQLINAGP